MFVEIGTLQVGDEFEHVNQPYNKERYVVRRIAAHHVIFTSIGGQVELGVEKNYVVKKLNCT